MKLFVGIPLHSGVFPWQTVSSINATISHPPDGVKIELKVLQGESNIVEARNRLTAEALQSDCEKLLMVDADMVWKPWHVKRIVSHDTPVVGGIYSKKLPGEPQFCCQGMPGQDRGTPGADGLIRVSAIGTGFLCMDRIVFERMDLELKPDRYRVSQGFQSDYWFCQYGRAADGSNYYLGEDYSFCARLGQMGIPVYADSKVCLGHVGTMMFPYPSLPAFQEVK